MQQEYEVNFSKETCMEVEKNGKTEILLGTFRGLFRQNWIQKFDLGLLIILKLIDKLKW